MPIHIFAKWKGYSEADVDSQVKAWASREEGGVGYLYEECHGGPYATRHLVAEAFEAGDGAKIPASVLRERLPQTLRLATERERRLYGSGPAELQRVLDSYTAFVELCERKEQQTGEPVLIIAFY